MSIARIEWLQLALSDLDEAVEYIAGRDPDAARRIAAEIWGAARLLRDHPKLGRVGRVSGTRELPVRNTPYLLAYRIHNGKIQILRLLHAARRWPEHF